MSKRRLTIVIATAAPVLFSTLYVASSIARHAPATRAISSAPCTTVIQAGYHVETEAANGLLIVRFDTPHGKLTLNLPDDMAAGDTVSGTVNLEPAGRSVSETAANQKELNGYVIDVGGQKSKATARMISFMLPETITPEVKVVNLIHGSESVARAEMQISPTPAPPMKQFTLPTGGQRGRNIQIKCPCNGRFAPDDSVRIGGTTASPIAESPRKLIVQDTSTATGPTKIEVKDNGATAECPFRNIGIKLSAPKTDLKRGEKTELHVEVSGLAGLSQTLPLRLVNESTTIINMSGGDSQSYVISPQAVPSNGNYALNRTLTGIQPGSFTITGTVTWSDTCNKDSNGGPIAGGPGPVSQPTPSATPLTPTDTASGEVCKWVNYKTYRVDEFKRVRSMDPNLEVRNESAHGGGTAVSFHCKAAGTFVFVVTKESGSDVVSVTCTNP